MPGPKDKRGFRLGKVSGFGHKDQKRKPGPRQLSLVGVSVPDTQTGVVLPSGCRMPLGDRFTVWQALGVEGFGGESAGLGPGQSLGVDPIVGDVITYLNPNPQTLRSKP